MTIGLSECGKYLVMMIMDKNPFRIAGAARICRDNRDEIYAYNMGRNKSSMNEREL